MDEEYKETLKKEGLEEIEIFDGKYLQAKESKKFLNFIPYTSKKKVALLALNKEGIGFTLIILDKKYEDKIRRVAEAWKDDYNNAVDKQLEKLLTDGRYNVAIGENKFIITNNSS